MTTVEADLIAAQTPGPWRAEERHGEIAIIGHPSWPCRRFGVDGEWTIATMANLVEDDEAAIGEADANARLIAAAPDLLEALRTLCSPDASYHDGEIRIPLSSHGAALEAMRKARAAISSARSQ